MYHGWLGAIVLGGLAFAPVAAKAAGQPPAPVLARINALDGACRAAGGQPQATPYVFVHDFDGDGRKDFLVDEKSYACLSRPNVFRTAAGLMNIEVFISDARGGAASAYRAEVGAYQIMDTQPRTVAIVLVGAACGGGSTAGQLCNGQLQWNPASRRFNPAVKPTLNAAGQRVSVDMAANKLVSGAPPGAGDSAAAASSKGTPEQFVKWVYQTRYFPPDVDKKASAYFEASLAGMIDRIDDATEDDEPFHSLIEASLCACEGDLEGYKVSLTPRDVTPSSATVLVRLVRGGASGDPFTLKLVMTPDGWRIGDVINGWYAKGLRAAAVAEIADLKKPKRR